MPSFSPELHHELGIAHLLSGPRRALWAGMGLGKTAMTLSALDRLFKSGQSRGALVVAPLRVCVLTWPAEVQKWEEFRWMRVAQVMTNDGWAAMEHGLANIYVINWDMLPFISTYFLHGKRAEQLPFDTVVFDETTKAKNHESKRVNLFRAYVNKFQRRWGLTGTPAPNSLMELFAQIRLLDDGRTFGPSFSQFQQAYFMPLDPRGYTWVLKQGSEEKIHAKVADIAMVLRSSDYLDIPDTVVTDVDVSFPVGSRKLYDELEEELLAITDEGEEVVAVNKAVLTNKLLQVTGGAVYLEQEYSEDQRALPRKVVNLHDAKMKALLSLLKKLHPEPVLIACQYRHEQDRIAAILPGSVRFDSASTPAAMQSLENRWNAGGIPYLLVHPSSMGHGLNLQQGGRIVVWYTLTYSGEGYDQLNGRLARTGQRKVPEVYRLICPGTMDDAVVASLESKGDTQNTLLVAVENLRKLREASHVKQF